MLVVGCQENESCSEVSNFLERLDDRIRCRDSEYTTVAFVYPPQWLQRCLVVTWFVPRETAAVSAQVLCTPCNDTPVYSVTLFQAIFIQSMHHTPSIAFWSDF